MNNASKKSKQPKKQPTPSAAAAAGAKALVKAERKALKQSNRASVGAAVAVARLDAEAAAIAGSVIAPDAFPACRLQDGYDNFPTALCEPKIVVDIPFSPTDGGLDALGYPNNEQWLFAFRQPGRGLVIPKHQMAATSSYLLSSDGNTSITRAAATGLLFNLATGLSGGQVIDDAYMMAGISGDAGAGGFFPVVYGTTWSQTAVGGLAASTAVTATFDITDGDENVFASTATATTAANGTVTWVLDNNMSIPLPTYFVGYARLRQVSLATSAAAFTLNCPANTAYPVHVTLGNFLAVQAMIEEFRANGLGLTFTNTVNALARQGDVCAVQIPKGVAWPALMRGGFGALTKRPGAVTMRADNGIQISWKPTSPQDMEFLNVGITNQDAEFYSITPESDYLAICITAPLAGRTGIAQVHCNAETRTNSPWFAATVGPAGSREATSRAMDLVRTSQQIHENPKHVADAIAFLRKHKKGIGAVASAVGAAFPVLAPLTGAINGGLNYL